MLAEAKQRVMWDHTATLCALLFNLNRGKNTPVKQVEDFHPFRKKKKFSMSLADFAKAYKAMEEKA